VQVDVLFPRAEAFAVEDALPVFTIATVRPEVFLDEEFAATYLRSGNLYCLSIETAAEEGNGLCVERGVLRMLIDSETYESLGIECKACPGTGMYEASIPVASRDFRSGRASYDRTAWCLKRMSPVRIVACSVSDTGAVRRVAFPPHLTAGLSDAACRAERRTLARDVRVPDLAGAAASGLSEEEADDLHEWLGLAHCGALACAAARPRADDFASALQAPRELPWAPGAVSRARLRGLLPPAAVASRLARARAEVASGACVWAAVAAWAAPRAPQGGRGRSEVTAVIVLPGGARYVALSAPGGSAVRR